MRLRPGLLRVHLVAALVIGLLLAVICLSGSVAVLVHDLDRWRFGQQGGAMPSADALVAAARTSHPEGVVTYIVTPAATGGGAEVWVTLPDERNHILYADAQGTLVASNADSTVTKTMHWIAELHMTLFLGEVGGWLLGIAAFALLGFLITGVALWWQGWRRSWVALWRVRWGLGGFLRHYDLHRTLALWSLPVLLLVALTGAVFEFAWVRQALHFVLGGSQAELPAFARDDHAHVAWRDDPILPYDRLVAIAEGAAPGLTAAWIPGAPQRPAADSAHPHEVDPWTLYATYPGNLDVYAGGVLVHLDPWSGAVLGVDDTRGGSLGAWFTRNTFALHTGWFGVPDSAASWFGRILYILVGLVPSILLVTGVGIWLHRRRQADRVSRADSSSGMTP
jgi:uncharacterized iron-regulated membrane protein